VLEVSVVLHVDAEREHPGASVAACHTQGMDARATAFQARNENRISPGDRVDRATGASRPA